MLVKHGTTTNVMNTPYSVLKESSEKKECTAQYVKTASGESCIIRNCVLC